ncbi:MAG: mechanosensitive ion channel [Planctomycetota bacterium]|nr:mechanosensitive ion channel [Planctomycetota bacterium]
MPLLRVLFTSSLLLLFAMTSVSSAQEPEKGSAKTGSETLENRLKGLVEKDLLWKDQVRRLNANKELLDENRRRLIDLIGTSGGIVAGPIQYDSKWLKKRLDSLSAELSSIKTQAKFGKLIVDQLKTRVVLFEQVSKTNGDYVGELRAFLIPFNKLSAAKRLELEAEIKKLSLGSLSNRQESLVKQGEDWKKELVGVKASLKKQLESMAKITERVPKIEKEIVRLTELYKEVLHKEDSRKELKKKEATSLAGLYLTKSRDQQEFMTGFNTDFNELEKVQDQLKEFTKALRANTPPIPSKIQSKARVPGVKRIESTLLLAKATKAYHEARLKVFNERSVVLKKSTAVTKAVISNYEKGRRLVIDLEVVTELILEGIKNGSIAKETKKLLKPGKILTADKDRLSAAREVAEALSSQVEKLSENDLEALRITNKEVEQLNREIPKLSSKLEREKALAVFVEKVAQRDNKDLLKLLKESIDAAEKAESDAATAAETMEDRNENLSGILDERRSLEDPFARRLREKSPGLRLTILNDLRKRGGYPTTEVTGNRLDGKSNEPAGSSAKEIPDERERKLRLILTLFEDYEQYLKEQIRLAKESVEVLEQVGDQRRKILQTKEAERDLLRRVYGCNEEIQIRLALGMIKNSEIKQQVSESDIRKKLSKTDADLVKKREEIESIEAAARVEQSALNRWSKQLTEPERLLPVLSKLLKLYINRKRALSETKLNYANLNEFEQKALQDSARDLLENETVWDERALTFFSTDRVEDFTSRILVLYREVTNSRRKLKKFEEARRLTETMIGTLSREEEAIRNVLPDFQKSLARFKREEEVAYARAVASVDPSKASELVAAMKNKYDVLISPIQASKDDLAQLTDEVFELRLLRQAYEDLIDRFDKRVSRLGSKSAAGDYKDDLVQYQRDSREILEDSTRIMGGPESSLTGEGGAQGEIDQLRGRRYNLCVSLLSKRAFSLVLIPLIAWFVLAVSRRLAARMIQHFEVSGTDGLQVENRDREQRRQTLIAVFGTAWKAVVVVVTIIYLLKQLGVDVTPIVASAGVVGLAVAFGAQNLVQDFLSGFFILLENQYKIGDFVTMGDKSGYVEEITLRMTVLRGKDGDRHFIPNGEVKSVTNQTQIWSGFNLDIGVSYDENPDKVIQTLRQTCKAMHSDSIWARAFYSEPTVCGIEGFGDSSVDFRILLKTRPGKQWDVARELRRRIKHAFDAEDIEIPFPQRVVHQASSSANAKVEVEEIFKN